MRQVAFTAALAVLAVSVAGCEDLRQAAGMEKIEPDEFAITTRAPLVVPPEYNLRPPAPGAAPTNTLDPTQSAQAAVLGQQAPITGVNGQLSVGEQQLIRQAGAADATSTIRQQIAADNRNMQMADQSFTNTLLFGLNGKADNSDAPVNANAEQAKIEAKQDGIVATKPAQQDTITKTKNEDKDSGWFGGMFNDVF